MTSTIIEMQRAVITPNCHPRCRHRADHLLVRLLGLKVESKVSFAALDVSITLSFGCHSDRRLTAKVLGYPQLIT